MVVGDLDVGEGELARVRGVPAHLLELARHLVAGHLALQNQEREAVVAALRARPHRTDEEVRAHAVGDERLRPVDDVSARDLARGRPDVGDVRAGARLRDPERPDQLAPDPGHDPAPALLLGAEVEHRRHRDLGVGVEPRRHPAGATRARELLDPDRFVDVGAALPAVLLRELEPQEAKLPTAVEQLARELARLLPCLDVGRDLVGDEAADALSELLVLIGERRQGRAAAGVLDDAHRRRGLSPRGSCSRAPRSRSRGGRRGGSCGRRGDRRGPRRSCRREGETTPCRG